jgi:CRISPR-associated protein Cst2
MTKIGSISINGRITLDMHSLNNEGAEGNQVLTRQVTIIDENGKLATVTAVSGDMMKHIMCEHFWTIAKEENLPLSNTSSLFNANRIIPSDLPNASANDHIVTTDEVLKTCSLSDIAGAMITGLGNFSRKSIAEFGWLVALPQVNETENYFHAKYVPNAANVEIDESNIGQNIFHRPANSGIYAFVGNLEILRLGYNDISKEYPISDEEREKRYKSLLKSLLYTFIKPNGAMRNTQNPHIVNFEGVITYSTSTCPAPTVSALNSNYKEEIEKITKNLNEIPNNSLTTIPFSSLAEFTEKFKELINTTEPNKL